MNFRLTLCVVALLCGASPSVFADARSQQCSVNIASLVDAARSGMMFVPRGPVVATDLSEEDAVERELARQAQIRTQMLFRVYMVNWYYLAKDFDTAQVWLSDFNQKLGWLSGWGAFDSSAVGQPDFISLTTSVQSCLTSPPVYQGLQTMTSGADERAYYLQLPADYDVSAGTKPLLLAFHGTGGTYERWVGDNAYDLADVVGDDAILVFPNALPDGAGVNQWNFLTDDSYDFFFFEDLLAELDARGLEYDKSKIFATGHSSGGGFSHELGCKYGDVLRGIAPSAGARLSGACTGGVGVLMSQGENDALVPLAVAEGTRDFWLKYNGLDTLVSAPGAVAPCIDYQPALVPRDYPVVWCQHSEGSPDDFSGHAWGSFTSEAVWQFFSTLSDLAPSTDVPPGGGNDAVLGEAETTISFTLNWPEEMDTPLLGAVILYPENYINEPTCAIPSVILNFREWVPGIVTPGSTVTYTDVALDFEATPFNEVVTFPSVWTMQIVVYVEGGGSLLPAVNKDIRAILQVELTDRDTPLVIAEPLDAEVVTVDVCATT